MKKIITAIAITLMAFACGTPKTTGPDLLPAENFDTTINDVPIRLYTLKNAQLTMQVTNFGGRIVTLFAPDKNGELADVVLGHRTIGEYVHPTGERFVGCCVGPIANRISGASFTIDGVRYDTPVNDNGVNTLHGGLYGLDSVPWKVVECESNRIVLRYTHPDGFEGYPGNLEITMMYTLTSYNDLRIEYAALTDKATPINLSNHSFFNLRGEGNGDILSHVMTINASNYTPVDSLLIPTGEIQSVENTPLDFREPHTIGERIGQTDNQQIAYAGGYDHNWVLDKRADVKLSSACTVLEPESGRCLEVLTDQSGMQFYAGNFFNGEGVGACGKPIEFRSYLALETQCFPNSVNQKNFPSIILTPDKEYSHTCIYRFSVKQ